jgi:nitrous oxidase accessory protein NosD
MLKYTAVLTLLAGLVLGSGGAQAQDGDYGLSLRNAGGGVFMLSNIGRNALVVNAMTLDSSPECVLAPTSVEALYQPNKVDDLTLERARGRGLVLFGMFSQAEVQSALLKKGKYTAAEVPHLTLHTGDEVAVMPEGCGTPLVADIATDQGVISVKF